MRTSRWLTGGLATLLLIFVSLQPAVLPAILWIAHNGDHAHRVVVQTDGNHLDIRLAHRDETGAHEEHNSQKHHETSLGLIASLFATHDHEGTDHVLHFNLSEAPDQIRQRNLNVSAPTQAKPILIFATKSLRPSVSAPQHILAVVPLASQPLSASIIGLATTVLLI